MSGGSPSVEPEVCVGGPVRVPRRACLFCAGGDEVGMCPEHTGSVHLEGV